MCLRRRFPGERSKLGELAAAAKLYYRARLERPPWRGAEGGKIEQRLTGLIYKQGPKRGVGGERPKQVPSGRPFPG